MTTIADDNMFDALSTTSSEPETTNVILESSPESIANALDKLEVKSTTSASSSKKFVGRKMVLAEEKKEEPEKKENPMRCTKPCSYALTQDDGKRGVCYRETCDYAHSLEEYRILPCAFGYSCRYRHKTCKFLHPRETKDDFFARTRLPKPDLPDTSENVRRPKKRRMSPEEMRKEQEDMIEHIKKNM